mmetsp:Transcript_3234/g.3575  ORF Transcript_3234/g.3575 Transcript_3234/m.3575 type:complete len:106 (-) Transcript_3234:241-558(-)
MEAGLERNFDGTWRPGSFALICKGTKGMTKRTPLLDGNRRIDPALRGGGSTFRDDNLLTRRAGSIHQHAWAWNQICGPKERAACSSAPLAGASGCGESCAAPRRP